MPSLSRSGLLISAALLVASALVAGFTLRTDAAAETTDPRALLAAKLGASVANVRETPVPGIYEVSEGIEVLYVSADGKYMFAGDFYDLTTRSNLTDNRRADIRGKLLATVRDEDTIPFLAQNPKYELYVFTDVDCGYCRRLHAQMPELNRLGISIRYLAFPRTGMNTEGARKLEAVWCAENRQQALTTAKTGAAMAPPTCKTPVGAQFQLGAAVGLQGTPAMYTKSGASILNGSPEDILAQLQKQPAGG